MTYPEGMGRTGEIDRGGFVRHVVLGVVVSVLVGGLVVVVGTGNGESLFRVRDAGAWLTNAGRGELVHVDALSGRTDARVHFKGAKGKLKVVHGPKGVYVVDEEGTIWRLDESTWKPSTPQEVGIGARLAVGVGWVYVVRDRSIQQLDPFSLDKAAEAVVAPAPVSREVIDDEGTLWAASPDTGDVLAVRDGRLDRSLRGGDPQDPILPTVAGGKATLTNADNRDARRTRLAGLEDPTPLADPGEIQVAARLESDRLYVGVGSRVARIDPDSRVLDSWGLGDTGGSLGEPLVNGSRVYVHDRDFQRLLVLDAQTGEKLPDVGELKDDAEIFVNNGFLFINNPNEPTAKIIDDKGQVLSVSDKYRDDVPSTDDQQGSAVKRPAPRPAPDPVDPTTSRDERHHQTPSIPDAGIPPIKLPDDPQTQRGDPNPTTPTAPVSDPPGPDPQYLPPVGTKPDPPSNVQAQCRTGPDATLSWDRSPSDPSADYELTVAGPQSGFPKTIKASQARSGSPAFEEAIASKAQYSILATNSTGRSTPATGTAPDCGTLPVVGSPPDPPTNLTDGCNRGYARIQWTPKAPAAGQETPTGHAISYTTAAGTFTDTSPANATSWDAPVPDAAGPITSVSVAYTSAAGTGTAANVGHTACASKPNISPISNVTSGEMAVTPVSITVDKPVTLTVSGAPPGISINGNTLAGTIPADALNLTQNKSTVRQQTYSVTVRAEDQDGNYSTATFQWTVKDDYMLMPNYVSPPRYGCGASCGESEIEGGLAFNPVFYPAYQTGVTYDADKVWRQEFQPGQPIKWGATVKFHYWNPSASECNPGVSQVPPASYCLVDQGWGPTNQSGG